jgi:RHS repeat-associated protein
VTFKYDPFGRRIQKAFTVNSVTTTTNYLYDGPDVIEEMDASGNQVARYSMGIAIDEPLAMTRGGVTSFYEADGLGSITSLTNSSGTITDSYTYDSFGQMTFSGSTTNPFRYTGREWDSETGLYYYRARYYNPQAGRFISEDPLKFGGGDANFYAYVGNSPAKFRDPAGLQKGEEPLEEKEAEEEKEQEENALEPMTVTPFTARPIPEWEQVLIKLPPEELNDYLNGNVDPIDPKVQEAINWLRVLEKMHPEIAHRSFLVEQCEREAAKHRQWKQLSKGELKALEKAGYHPHDLKPNSRYDIYKDPATGEVRVFPKGNLSGPGDPTNLYIRNLKVTSGRGE